VAVTATSSLTNTVTRAFLQLAAVSKRYGKARLKPVMVASYNAEVPDQIATIVSGSINAKAPIH